MSINISGEYPEGSNKEYWENYVRYEILPITPFKKNTLIDPNILFYPSSNGLTYRGHMAYKNVYGNWYFQSVSVYTDSVELAKLVLYKEIVGNIIAINWAEENRLLFTNISETETTVLIDGLAYLYTGNHFAIDYHPWDGISIPSCEMYYVVDTFSKNGNIIPGRIQSIMERYCPNQPPTS